MLHHLADPLVGMTSLAGCLRRDGAIGLTLYAERGRVGVEMLQSVFRDLGLDQGEASVHAVKEMVALLAPDHPVQNYLRIEGAELKYDGAVVDTFLHGRDRSYSVDDCIDLLTSAGLAFQGGSMRPTTRTTGSPRAPRPTRRSARCPSARRGR